MYCTMIYPCWQHVFTRTFQQGEKLTPRLCTGRCAPQRWDGFYDWEIPEFSPNEKHGGFFSWANHL